MQCHSAAVHASGTADVDADVYDSTLNQNNIGISFTARSAQLTIDAVFILNSAQTRINITSGTVSLADSTIENSQANGIDVTDGSLNILNSTISDGYYATVYVRGGSTSISRSILSGYRLNGVDVNDGVYC